MSHRLCLLQLIALPFLVAASDANDPQWCNQFRGPERNGVYASQGLLRTWAEGGPALLWQREGIGHGYSSPIVTPDGIFVTGDEDGELVITSLAPGGETRWRKPNGAAWANPFPGARATCAYHRGRLYHLNAHGRLACLDAKTGDELWAVGVLEQFDAPGIQWGISECVLVDGNRVFATPGGPETLMVCLNAETGELIWKSEPLRFQRTMAFGGKPVDPPVEDTDKAGYASPVLFRVGGRELIATASARHFVLVDAKDGGLLWSQQVPVRHEVIGAIPIVQGNDMFFSAPDCGGFRYHVSVADGAVKVEKKWEISYDNGHGAMVLADGKLFGSGYRKNRAWAMVDGDTGEVLASLEGLPKGSAVWADGRVYAQSERGTLLLLEPTADALAERGRLVLTDGKKADQWAHPVIHDGKLYLRVGDAIRCYRIRGE